MALPPGAAGLKFGGTPNRPPQYPDAWHTGDRSVGIRLSDNDRTATNTFSTRGVRSFARYLNGPGGAGKFYAEVLVVSTVANDVIGLKAEVVTLTIAGESISCTLSSGSIFRNSTTVGSIGGAVLAGDTVCIAFDPVAERVWFRKNSGNWNNNIANNPATGVGGFDISILTDVPFAVWFNTGTIGASAYLRTRVEDFVYSLPDGFSAWLPAVEPISAADDSYALTGSDAIFVTAAGGITLAADGGTYGLTGSAAALKLGHVGSAGSFTLAGSGAALALGHVASAGSYAISGSTAAFKLGYVAAAGSYALTGSAAALATGLSAATGSYALTGAVAAIQLGYVAGAGSYTLTGADVSFATGVGNVTLSAAGGSYALTGSAAAFVTSDNIILAAAAGSYVLSGADAVLARKLVCDAGFYTFNGAPVTLAIRATADSGAYALTGSAAELATAVAADYTLAAAAGSYTLSGSDASFVVEPVAEAAVGGGGAYYPPPRPFPVIGHGFGILPQLEGEAHGTVVVVGVGAGTLPQLRGEAAGSVGVAGRSAGQLALVRAVATGNSGQAGRAVAVLKGLSVTSTGAVGTYGAGLATLEMKGAAVGQHDDDEAAVMTFLLAA